jgi:hypothetical protein
MAVLSLGLEVDEMRMVHRCNSNSNLISSSRNRLRNLSLSLSSMVMFPFNNIITIKRRIITNNLPKYNLNITNRNHIRSSSNTRFIHNRIR